MTTLIYYVYRFYSRAGVKFAYACNWLLLPSIKCRHSSSTHLSSPANHFLLETAALLDRHFWIISCQFYGDSNGIIKSISRGLAVETCLSVELVCRNKNGTAVVVVSVHLAI